jgi:hypothetical protein
MTVPVLESLVVAVADDLDDRRLQFADVIVLPVQPTALSATRLIVATLCRLPGCALVGAGVAAGGCLLGARDMNWLVVGTGEYPQSAVKRLACWYYLVVMSTVIDHRERQGALSDRRRADCPAPRRGPWQR